MSTIRNIHPTSLLLVVFVLLVALTAPAEAQAPRQAVAGTMTAAAATKAKAKKPALKLTASRKKVTAGSKVRFRVANGTKAKRKVRVQRWDPKKRVWRKVTTRKVSRSATFTVKVPNGTWRYRAVAAKAKTLSKGKVRKLPAVRSTTIAIKGTRPSKLKPSPRPVAPRASKPGSLPVGSASYVVPVGAVFVAASGSSGGSGSQSDPFGSLGAALAKVKSGSTLVLRGGSYHESVRVPFNKKVTIQPYPGEAVWLDGTVPVTGWQKSGSSWFVSGWNHNLDSRVSFNSAADQSDWFVDPKYPMAGHPDQVWIGGQRLAEVGSAAAVKPGTFFVDTAAKRLVVGSDPTSKQVRASVLQRALQIQGEGTIVRGIGVRRYANTLHLMGAVTAEVHDLALENMVITENATVGLYGWNDRHRFRRLTITDNGMLGFGHAGAKDMVLTESIVSGNNSEHFNGAPVAGGIKIGRSTGVTVSANLVRDNINSSGIWLDESVKGATVVANTVRDNDTTGIMAEISDNVVIADNHVTGNRGTGIWS
ncbi:hypothetical protein GL325_06590, partial [Aeromicrobium sp. 636]